MLKWMGSTILTIGLLTGAAAIAQPVEMEGQKFEPTAQLGGQSLVLNGVGLRKRAIFKVYVGGLYVAQKSSSPAAVIGEKGPRRVSLRMLRDVDADSFISSFNDGLKANLSEAELAAFKPRIDALMANMKTIGEAKKGDAIDFEFTPEAGTRIAVNGQPKGSPIAGGDFFAAVLRIWLGDKPVDDGLKKGMLGG